MSGDIRDSELAEILAGSVWYPSRHVDTAAVESFWEQSGVEASEAARKFAAEFDGVVFDYPRHPVDGGVHYCALDAVRATRSIHPETRRSYEGRVLESLCPIGISASGHLILLMGTSGRVFGGYDAFLALYGESGRQAISNTFHRVRPARLPSLPDS